jgi:hypothetical protein
MILKIDNQWLCRVIRYFLACRSTYKLGGLRVRTGPASFVDRFTDAMRLTNFLLFAPLTVGSPTQTGQVSYDGYQVFSITPSSVQEARALQERFSRYHTHPIRDALSIAVPPEEVGSFTSLGLDAHVVNKDLGKYIRSISKSATYDRALHKRGELPDLSWFDTYHAYSDHLEYWDSLVQAFPNNSEKFSIGNSYENRTIYAYRLFGDTEKGAWKDGKSRERVEKPVILWHATVHAREVQ